MLGIKINNEFLDIPSDVAMELQRNNPFLSDDDVPGEFSMGLTIRYTDINYRLLNYQGSFYKENKKISIDAQLYEKGVFRYGGKLVLNRHDGNMNNIQDTVWTGFFTIGSASFYQDIKDKYLKDINLGGIRTFTWDGLNFSTGTGFWRHIHQAITPNAFPYTFYPIYNPGWDEGGGVKWMNRYRDNDQFYGIPGSGTAVNLFDTNANSLCPAIYYSYILERIFAQFGWKMAGSLLTDAGFVSLTMPSFQAIHWVNFVKIALGYYQFSTMASISFDLAEHVPQQQTVGGFLANLKTRFGWYFDYNSNTKTATLRSLKALSSDNTVKDFTQYALSKYSAEYQDETKIYSLINNIDSADNFPILQKINYNGLLPAVYSKANLPPNTGLADGAQIFVFLENAYFINQFDGSAYTWVLYSHNVGDYEPANSNATIESDISTMPTLLLDHPDGVNFYGLVPNCKQQGNFQTVIVVAGTTIENAFVDWGMRALFYYGLQASIGGSSYPFASSNPTATNGTVLGNWSITYKRTYGATSDGTYDYWFKDWLTLSAIQDARTIQLQLPITELKKISFNDKIIINNVWFLVKSFKEILPYNGTIEAVMKRIY